VEISTNFLPFPRIVKFGTEGAKMRFQPRAHLQGGRVDFDKIAVRKELANSLENESSPSERVAT
jgi:hypothetical protein